MKLKKIFILLCIIALGTACGAAQYVKGYYKKDGTYVRSHFRSNRDNRSYNNFSTKGNYNPYTRQKGYKKHTNSYKYYNGFKSRKKI